MKNEGIAVALLLALAAGLAACGPAGVTDAYDVVIENGRVGDGTGASWFRGDVAIEGDRIARIEPADVPVEIYHLKAAGKRN